MRLNRLKKIVIFLLICLIFSSGVSFAQELTLFQKLLYEKVYILEPAGRENLGLVNRFTRALEYVWIINKWASPPKHVQHCYRNQAFIRANYKRR